MNKFLIPVIASVFIIGTFAVSNAYAECPVDFTEFNGHCYNSVDARFIPNTWQDANDAAIAAGGHLVVINDSAENDFIQTIVPGQRAGSILEFYWIGLTCTDNCPNFEWINGDVLSFTDWRIIPPTETTNTGVGYGHVDLVAGNWLAYDLSLNLGGYVIEIDPNATPPGTVIDSDTDGNQNVGSDDSLIITNGATINGNIKVNGGTLILEDGCTINGNITIKNGGDLTIDNCDVNGNVKVKKSNQVTINDSHIDGNLDIKKTDDTSITNNSINGNIKIKKSSPVIVSDNTINGNLDVKKSETCNVFDNEVNGNVKIGNCGTEPLSGGGLPGALDLIEEGTGVIGITFTAILQEPITTCPEDIVCGVGIFLTDLSSVDAAMVTVTVNNPDVTRGQSLIFENDSDCNSGLALVSESDFFQFTVDENTISVGPIRTIGGFDSEVHSFTTESGSNGETCLVIVDTVI